MYWVPVRGWKNTKEKRDKNLWSIFLFSISTKWFPFFDNLFIFSTMVRLSPKIVCSSFGGCWTYTILPHCVIITLVVSHSPTTLEWLRFGEIQWAPFTPPYLNHTTPHLDCSCLCCHCVCSIFHVMCSILHIIMCILIINNWIEEFYL